MLVLRRILMVHAERKVPNAALRNGGYTMKTLISTLALLFSLGFAVSALAADDDSKDDEVIDPEEQETVTNNPETLTDMVSSIGDELSGDPCAGVSYAEQVYCYPAQWLANLLPCTYGAGTLQATLCPNNSWSVPAARTNSEYDVPRAVGPVFELNPDYRPLRAESRGLRQHLLSHLAQAREGQTVQSWRDGTRLILRIKMTMSRDGDQAFVFEMVNDQGRVIGRPVYYFKGDTLFINDLSRQSR